MLLIVPKRYTYDDKHYYSQAHIRRSILQVNPFPFYATRLYWQLLATNFLVKPYHQPAILRHPGIPVITLMMVSQILPDVVLAIIFIVDV